MRSRGPTSAPSSVKAATALGTLDTTNEGRGIATLRSTPGEGRCHRTGSRKASARFLRLLYVLAPLTRPPYRNAIPRSGQPPRTEEGLVMVHVFRSPSREARAGPGPPRLRGAYEAPGPDPPAGWGTPGLARNATPRRARARARALRRLPHGFRRPRRNRAVARPLPPSAAAPPPPPSPAGRAEAGAVLAPPRPARHGEGACLLCSPPHPPPSLLLFPLLTGGRGLCAGSARPGCLPPRERGAGLRPRRRVGGEDGHAGRHPRRLGRA